MLSSRWLHLGSCSRGLWTLSCAATMSPQVVSTSNCHAGPLRASEGQSGSPGPFPGGSGKTAEG